MTAQEQLDANKAAVQSVIDDTTTIVESGDTQQGPRAARELALANAIMYVLNDTVVS